jgi:hypothetical protein
MYQRVVLVQAERVGQPPVLPSPQDIIPSQSNISQQSGTPNQILLSMRLMPQTLDTTPDAQGIYRANAEYLFALDGTPDVGQGLPIGNSPWANPAVVPYQNVKTPDLAGGNA